MKFINLINKNYFIMIKIPSIIEIKPESKIVSINEFFRDIFKLVDTKFKHIDIYPL